jgi:hypothetical protein
MAAICEAHGRNSLQLFHRNTTMVHPQRIEGRGRPLPESVPPDLPHGPFANRTIPFKGMQLMK